MADKLFENNQVTMIGEIVSEFEFSHEVYGEGFYLVDISVSRLSDSVDYIPLMLSLIHICVIFLIRKVNQSKGKIKEKV